MKKPKNNKNPPIANDKIVPRKQAPTKKRAAPKKKVSPKKTKKVVDKPFADGTMSSSAFFTMIRSSLRNRSRFWSPITKKKNQQKIPYTGPNKRRKFSYVCEGCGGEYDSKAVSVHHKVHAGKLNCFEDLPDFVRNLFCSISDLQLLCKTCHDKEHKKETE